MISRKFEITYQDRVTHGEYVARNAGSDEASRLTWTMRGDVRHAEHTFVPVSLRGQGIAGKLVEAMVADARQQGFRIAPDCAFVASEFRRHPEWADLRA